MFTGIVTSIGKITQAAPRDQGLRLAIDAGMLDLSDVAPGDSIAVNGVSLTVNRVDGAEFEINLIPHTIAVTNLKNIKPGSRVNLEVDLIARYIERLQHYGA